MFDSTLRCVTETKSDYIEFSSVLLECCLKQVTILRATQYSQFRK